MRNKSPLSRRALLGGAASLFALPIFESLKPRWARAEGAKPQVRLVYIYVPNGLDMATFKPTTVGAGYEMPPMLKPLEALKADFQVVSGLENILAKPDMAGDHASGTAGFMTCIHANKSSTEVRLGISADQIAAQKLTGTSHLDSLQLGIDGGASSGGCDSGYSCAYARNVSWADAQTPLPKIIDPQLAFDRLFTDFDAGATAADAEKRRADEKSVIDAVLADVDGLKPKLGATDLQKLDQYLTGVRALEKQVVELSPGVTCTPGAKPAAFKDSEYPAHVKAMLDLMVLGLSCQATNVVSLMFGNAGSNRTHPFLNINGAHHEISHHQNNAANIALLAKIGLWEIEQLAYLFSEMKKHTDADGNDLLYNSAVFFSSEISDGNRHNHDDMPIILGGHAGGAFNPGKHTVFPATAAGTKEKVSNLLVTMLAAGGVPGATLGDSSGPLKDL